MHHRTARHAFSLLEMMLVVVIIGLLAGVVIVNFAGQGERARRTTTKAKMSQIKTAINQYAIDKGQYPDSLATLTFGETPYLERVPSDAWDRDFIYFASSALPGKNFTLFSVAQDGVEDTEDDIDVWTMDDDNAQDGA